MKPTLLSRTAGISAALIVLALSTAASATVKATVLHSFSGPDGLMPSANLITDPAGNLYGTTYEGGSGVSGPCNVSCGVAFELSPTANGTMETVLYNFCSVANCADGANPVGALVRDPAGNLYGVTVNGGEHNNCVDSDGCGVVFELTPNPDGTWTETVLHSFTGAEDAGENPAAGLVLDSAGNLYGTTEYSEVSWGLVFELSPMDGGIWQETVLYAFTGGQDGGNPTSLVLDSTGNLYGTAISGGDPSGTSCGGFNGCGVVFELTPNQDGTWQETVLHAFTGKADGGFPFGAVTISSTGDLFGAALDGGNPTCGCCGCGVAFELTIADGWAEKVLHSFSGADGESPIGNLTISPKGSIYGTTRFGGANERDGVVFELIPTRNGGWNEKGVSLGGKFGIQPVAGLTLGASGQVYGATSVGGVGRGGVVFEITK
jgi:uncharacterized repeat protein (TIGR03803 family)